MINDDKVKHVQKSSVSFKFKLFLLFKLPMGFLCGMRMKDLNNENLGGKDAGSIAAKKMRDKNNQFNKLNIVKEQVFEKLRIIFDKALKWLDD